MELDTSELDLGSEHVVEDLTDLVESMYNERVLFPGTLPDSPPDSGSEHLLSPANSDGPSQPHASAGPSSAHNNNQVQAPHSGGNYLHDQPYSTSGGLVTSSPTYAQVQQGGPTVVHQHLHYHRPFPDLSTIDYSVPLQLIEQNLPHHRQQGVTLQTLENIEPSRIILPRIGERSTTVRYRDLSRDPIDFGEDTRLTANSKKRKYENEQQARRLSVETDNNTIKSEVCVSPLQLLSPSLSPQSSSYAASSSGMATGGTTVNNNIKFSALLPQKWCKTYNARLQEISTTKLVVTADKGFNFSLVDDAFIVQKKNHFQLTCHVQINQGVHFVHNNDGEICEIGGFRLNFYGIKSEAQHSTIKVEQSQADRTKKIFHPILLQFGKGNQVKRIETDPDGSEYCDEELKVTVGRLHFAETTSNNMRKKGKPNPAQKYFQLVVGLEAMVNVGTDRQREFDLIRMASEKIIVRASNPGQFESEAEVAWCREPSSDTIYHIGKVGINSDQSSEALTIHGNVQITGQILQPSDIRIKDVLKELDSREQLEKVKQIKIVQYQYKPEFMQQFPESERDSHAYKSQTGVIAQEVRKILPDAVSSSGPYLLSNGEIIEDLLIVDKDRLFLENIGAVHELSKVTGNLGDRIEDLEKANEHVAVRLSRLKRASATFSTCSLNSNNSTIFRIKHQPRGPRSDSKSLFNNRCVQALLLAIVCLIALSLVSIAIVYIYDYLKRSTPDEGHTYLVQNSSFSEPYRQPEVVTLPQSVTQVNLQTNPIWGSQETSTHPWQVSSTLPPTTFQQFQPPVIGALLPQEEAICRAFSGPRCQSFCCGGAGNSIEFTSQQNTNQVSSNDLRDSPESNPVMNQTQVDPLYANTNFNLPDLNQVLMVETEYFQEPVDKSQKTAIETTTTESSTSSSTVPTTDTTLLTTTQTLAPTTASTKKAEKPTENVTNSGSETNSSTTSLVITSPQISENRDKAQAKDGVEDGKPEIKNHDDQIDSGLSLIPKSDPYKSKDSTLKEIIDDKKVNRIKESIIENFASSNETVNEVEYHDDPDFFDEKGDAVYVTPEEEKYYSLMPSSNETKREANAAIHHHPRSVNSNSSHTPAAAGSHLHHHHQVSVSRTNTSDWIGDHHKAQGKLNEIEDPEAEGNQPENLDGGGPDSASHQDNANQPRLFKRAMKNVRAKRRKRNFKTVRTVRETGIQDVGHHVNAKDTDFQRSTTLAPITADTQEPDWPRIVTMNDGNFTLDQRYCDPRDSQQYISCVSGYWNNVTLAVPLSKHFSDPNLVLVFAQNAGTRIAICSSDVGGNFCSLASGSSSTNSELSLITVGADGRLVFNISTFQSLSVRLRLGLDPSLNLQTVCGISPINLGTMYKEYNIRFYRVCDL